MNYSKFYMPAIILLLTIFLVSLPVFALSNTAGSLSSSAGEEISTSALSYDNTSKEDDESNPFNLELVLNILGSGLVCGALTRILDYSKEKKLLLLSAADALFAAFNAAFPDGFLDRDDDQWRVFKRQYKQFCNSQITLIERLKNNKYGADIISKLTAEILIQEINQVPGLDTRAKESAVRSYIGKQYNRLTTKIRG